MTISDLTTPPLQTSLWFNAPQPVTLDGLRGRVVVLHAFQMLCPGCVSHGLPQALRIHRLLSPDQVAVIGLHTVFEHHDVMGPEALRVFLHEYQIPFPVGVDRPDPGACVPMTMQDYGLRGTPSVLVFDRAGRVRLNHFGQIDDLQLGALLGQLLAEAPAQPAVDAGERAINQTDASVCADGACAV
ncbi:TlpA disulfide reductase family protein [Paucibacter sp. AS339]|uniref:TlpA disulfide reductase family protein n=1 Tax=Paucibacter hankyongi TaxID=3133434 RepID=UPI00309EFE31